jgi:hypothetical protein
VGPRGCLDVLERRKSNDPARIRTPNHAAGSLITIPIMLSPETLTASLNKAHDNNF